MFNKFTIKTKLLLGFSSIALIVFFITLVSFITSQQNISLFSKIVSVDTPRLRVLLNIKSLINEISAETSQYTIVDAKSANLQMNTPDQQKNALLASLEQLDSQGRKYDKLIKNEGKEQDGFFGSLSFIQKELIQDTTLLVTYKEQKAPQEVILPLENKMRANIALLQKKINLQVAKEQKNIDAAEKEAFARNAQSVSVNGIATLGAFLIALFIGVLISRIIVRPIIQVRNAALEIAEGKLDKRVVVFSQDEIGQLATTFNTMAKKLETSYAEVEQKVKERTQELHDEQTKLQASINSLSVGFIMVDRENNIITINHTARQTLCASATSPLATLPTCSLTHIEEELKGIVDLRAHINQCFEEKKSVTIRELKFQNRYLKIFITPIVTLGVIGGVILIDDITETKVVERSKDEFFSIASHELRTPLTAIRGNTSMIQQFYGEKIKDPILADMVSDIHESSVRLIAIVNDFLDSSRLEMGKMTFKKESFDIVKLTQDTIKEYMTTGSLKKLYLKLDPPPASLPFALGDQDKIKQVLINLVGNAIKFTEQGGITLQIVPEGSYLKVLVIDTGRGISVESQNLLFRKFQQAQDNLLTRDTTKGTGLGLYISRLMMDGMGGQIKIDSSEIGKGTTFSISIPVAITEVVQPAKTITTPQATTPMQQQLTKNL